MHFDHISRRGIIKAAISLPMIANGAVAQARGNASRVMVQGRPQDSASPYKLRPIMTALDKLGGVRLMRCRIPYQRTIGWNTYVGLARAGVRFCFTLTTRPLATTIQDLVAFSRTAPGAIWAIEYPNEPDLNPVKYDGKADRRLGARTGDAPALMAFCTEAYRLVRATPELRTVRIIAFNDYMQHRQVEIADYGNSHIYPRPNANVDALISQWRDKLKKSGFREGVITEWGRTTGGGARNFTAPPVSTSEQGQLLAGDVRRLLAEPALKVINLYELFSWGGGSEMNNFGLFEPDLQPRPAVNLLRELLI